MKSWIASGGTLNEEGKPLPAEMSSRVALAGKFLDEAPAIRAKIESGMATDTLEGKAKTYFNAGEQGEIARKVKSGTDALLRSLTGAGMPVAEAQKYVARYEITPLDTKDTALSKFDQLHDELTRSEQEAFRGRGGLPRDIMERRKAAHEGITKSSATAPGPAAPAAKDHQWQELHQARRPMVRGLNAETCHWTPNLLSQRGAAAGRGAVPVTDPNLTRNDWTALGKKWAAQSRPTSRTWSSKSALAW